MLKESVFYKFLNRRDGVDVNEYLRISQEDVDYINWNQFVLPNDYGDAELEYRAIRHSCALFDVSPMRKYQLRGSDAGKFLDHLLTRPVSDVAAMQGIYVAFCNADGSLKDDAILYKHAKDDYLLMPSDIDHSAYFEALRSGLGIEELSIIDSTDSLAGMAIQGPMSATVLKHMGFDGIELLKPFQVRDYSLKNGAVGSSLRIARMGFTADLGYECWMKKGLSKNFEQSLTAANRGMKISLPGYGLTALEACRLEGGFIVAGWDCSTEAEPMRGFERSPFELGLGWLVDLNAAKFTGRDALIIEQMHGGRFVRRSFKMCSEGRPDDGADIWAEIDGEDRQIGSVNCSSWSWNLGTRIGNASIIREFRAARRAWVVVDCDRLEMDLSRGPLISFERHRQVPAEIFE
ncbi:MAG: hypothetical protein CMQ12_11160 [Gammaproteobacteria bacterium]|nr:hypothetical protein [Gammaproteobacteria bacterium]